MLIQRKNSVSKRTLSHSEKCSLVNFQKFRIPFWNFLIIFFFFIFILIICFVVFMLSKIFDYTLIDERCAQYGTTDSSRDHPVRGFLYTHVHHSIILFKIAEVTFVIGICSSLRSVGLSCCKFSSMPATIFDCLIISKSTFNSTPSEAMRVTDILEIKNHAIIRVISVLKNCSN